MEKIRNLLILMFVLGGCLMSCEEKEGHNLTPQPILKIDKILIDGVEYQYNDTIAVSSANKVEIDYTIEAEGGLTQIQNLYVYGGTANNIKMETSFTDPTRYSGKLVCDDFLPFLCSFRVV